MASVITLYDLADLSIGTPEVGAVNFNALHILLHAIIKHLNIQELQTEITEEGGGLYKPPAGQVQLPPADQQQGGEALYYHKLHSKMMAMERQLEALNALPSGLELMERTKTQPAATTTPVGEMWQMMQMKKKIEANEDGVSKAMDLLQDLLHEISTLRQSHGDVDNRLQKVIDCLEPNQQETRQEFETQARQIELQGGDQEVLDKLRKELKSVQQRMIDLEGKLTQYPRPELLNNMVGWEELRETLVKCPSTMDATTSQPGQVTSPSPPKMSSIKSTSSLTKSGLSPKPSGVSVPTHSDRPLSTSTMAEAVVAPGIPPQDSASLTHPGDPVPASDGPRTAFNTLVPTHPPGSPGMTVPAPPTEDASTCKPSFPTVPPITMSRTASVSQRFPDTVEALRTLGTLSEEYDLLRCRVETLERDWMTVRAQLGEPELLCNLQEKLDLLQREMPNVKEDKEKGGDLLGQIQNKMLQLQEECENLNKTTGSLIQEQQQKQRHIDILYQSLEKLEEKKADKEQLEIDECGQKANKEALERKVSRTQFDSTTEQLNNMLQDLLSRVTGQEQDWQRVLDKISIEMQSKLDRMELDPFRMQLEDRWKAIYSQLLERSPQYEADEVAGIRKQLLARFHCISCDRPVAVRVPGQPILTIPNIPPLPAHRSMRPYTVYELDQIRQHNRNDRSQEMSDYGYISNIRSCGGSHTMTFPYQRYSKLQSIVPSTPLENENMGSSPKAEIDIMGFDGHIYRGRTDIRFPAIAIKEAHLKSRGKLSQTSLKSISIHHGNPPPTRPPSANLSGRNHSVRTSQDRNDPQNRSLTQADLVTRREMLEIRMDLALKQQSADESVM